MANPFVYRQPLPGRQGFINRASEIMRISSRIAAEDPQSVSIVGQLRVGKSSMLNWLSDPQTRPELLDEPERYVLLAVGFAQHPPHSPAEFFTLVSQAWKEQGGSGFEPDYDGFGGMVRGLMQEERKMVLLLDDFGLITQNSGFPLGFFSYMRSVANANNVGYVTTSEEDLQKLCYTQDIQESPFFNIFTTVHLEPFAEKEARALVTTLAASEGVDLSPEADLVIGLAGGSPYLLQLAGSLAFEGKLSGRVEPQAIADRAFVEVKPYLDKLWEGHLPAVQQEVLRAVAGGKEIDRRQEYAAESLVRHGHLARVEGQYRFRSALLARYVGEHGRPGWWRRLLG